MLQAGKLTQAIDNAALAIWILADALRVGLFVSLTMPGIVGAGLALTLLLTAAFVIVRPPPIHQDLSPSSVAIAVAAIALPGLQLLIGPAPVQPSWAGLSVQFLALVLLFTGILALRKSFSIVPQYREIVAGGPYMLVRHPIYSGYLIFDAAIVFEQGVWWGALLWCAEAILLAWRAEREERLLASSDGNYADYCTRVPYRFLPLIY